MSIADTATQERGAGSAAALTACLAADVLRELAQGLDAGEEASGLTCQAESLRQRAARLAEENQTAYERAIAALAKSRAEPGFQDHRIGEAMRGTLATLLQISDTAADVAELAGDVATLAQSERSADAAGAAALAEGTAQVAMTLISINLIQLPDGPEVREATLNLEAATLARRRAIAQATEP